MLLLPVAKGVVRWTRGVIIVLLLAAGARVAEAEEPASQQMVVIIDAGGVDLMVESMVRANIEAEMSSRGFAIPRGISVAGDLPSRLLSCSGDLECTRKVLKPVQVDHVLFLSLRTESDSDVFRFRMVARDFEVASGEVVARTQQKCENCQLEKDLNSFCARVVAELYRVVAVKDPDPVRIDPKSSPSAVPPRPLLAANSQEQSSERSPMFYGKYIALASGVAAIATGATLVVIDGPIINNDVRQPEKYETKSAGYITMGVGVALVGVGVALWTLEEENCQTCGGIKAGVLPTSEGGMVQVHGSF